MHLKEASLLSKQWGDPQMSVSVDSQSEEAYCLIISFTILSLWGCFYIQKVVFRRTQKGVQWKSREYCDWIS